MSTIVVTGGSGSFGRAMIRRLLRQQSYDLVVSISRNAEMRYKLEQDHDAEILERRLVVAPGDVRDRLDLEATFEGRIDAFIHAAAEKHVGTGENFAYYVDSVNNIGGRNAFEFAVSRGCNPGHFIALSTDKACLPVNAYGRSKAAAEQYFITQGATVVRYGNVVGSSGSVLPKFIAQAQAGEQITLTDPLMTRFFMPLEPEASTELCIGDLPSMSAVELVELCLRQMFGGYIVVPADIRSATMESVANAVLSVYGNGRSAISTSSARRGDKPNEDLISPEEGTRTYLCARSVFLIGSPPRRYTLWPVAKEFRFNSGQHPESISYLGPNRFLGRLLSHRGDV